jgi:hypothetical protein
MGAPRPKKIKPPVCLRSKKAAEAAAVSLR